ncbi:MAG TPA: cytochrome b N-terminal domain-containing protein [bacterium]|nr:cytochrome b N-terminal domain-containing protein [bacterium]
MPGPSFWQRLWAGLDARLALRNFVYEVPPYANTLPYLLGAITLMGLVILVATGILLGQFYIPDPAAANASVRTIMTQGYGGAVARGIHVYAAHFTLVVLLLHLGRVYVTGAYRFPREANWIGGVALLATVLAFFFTGTVMRWDQGAIEALEHNLAFAQLLGVFGGWFSPAFSTHVPLLARLYMAHVSLLPLVLFILIVGHVYLVRQHGFSPHWSRPAATQPPYTFAHHLRRAVGFGCIMLGVALALAVVRSPGEGPAPVPGIEVTKPPWVFLPAYALETWFGVPSLLWGTAAAFAWLVAVPFLDRSTAPGWSGRRRALAVGAAALIVVIGLGVFAWVSHPVAHLH